MNKKITIGVLLLIVIVGLYFLGTELVGDEPDQYACTMEAKQCPDGSFVGRVGPDCEFAQCPAVDQGEVLEYKDLIKVFSPNENELISSPLVIKGEARGYWFFEANFPVILTDWDGRIIAEHYAVSVNDWMTEDFVPFTATINFESPYNEGDPEFMRRGFLILQKQNASGLPENDDAFEIPVRFE